MEGDSRRNSSSDMMNATQACIPATKVILQKAPAIGTCLMNVQVEGNSKYLRENCYHHIKYTIVTFLAAFIWQKPLNNTALAKATHRKPKRVSDVTGTQVRAQMINKCRFKIVQAGLYNVKDPP